MKTAHGVILLLDRFPQAAAPKTIAPRQLMPVANRPLVEHAASALRDAGAATIFVAIPVGADAAAVREKEELAKKLLVRAQAGEDFS